MEQHLLTINGMGSQHCVGVVTRIISALDGASIDAIEIGKANISIDESKVSKQTVVDAIEKMGYKVEQ
ncbi:MAG: heavy-metal-associated domain-containing protein [Ferruginibacter sp.]